MTEQALAGLKVLEIGEGISGPFSCKYLGALGAEVIKIETPSKGDPTRRSGPFPGDDPHLEKSGLFLYLNMGKKSITLNLESEQGRDILALLIKDVDALIENFAPGVLSSLGLGFASLSAINPRLVMTSITPFGQTGPYRDFKSTNLVSFAMGGQMSLTGDPDREPLVNGGSQAEYQAGLNGFSSTAIATLDAKLTGIGQHIDISTMECLAATLEGFMPRYLYEGTDSGRTGNMRSATWGVYRCADGYVGIAAMPRNFPNVARGIGRADLLQDPKFDTPAARLENNDELEAIIQSWMLDHVKDEIYTIAGQARAPFGIVYSTAELMTSPQLIHNDFFTELDHPVAGKFKYPGAPVLFSETPWVSTRAPLLGENNEEIYLERLGLSNADLNHLKYLGII